MNINELTLGEIKELMSLLSITNDNKECKPKNTMIGRNCIIRTYSAGIHFGIVQSVTDMEVYLKNSYRIWKWTSGGLSISALANEGIKGGRLNFTGEILLTNSIEIIPVSKKFEESYSEFVEN
jgi:hypothetical protein